MHWSNTVEDINPIVCVLKFSLLYYPLYESMFCGNCSKGCAIGICLLEAGIDVMSGFNGTPRNNLYPSHEYLVTQRRGHEILIDPTIAQMIEGHNNAYVGARDQLREVDAFILQGYFYDAGKMRFVPL